MKQKVKKALSICSTASDCEDCPYYEGESCGCIGKLIKDISKVLEEGEKTLFYYKEENKLLRALLAKAHDEAARDFAHFLIDKAVDGNVSVCDLPDLVIEWGEEGAK